ncbi:hypothetical protein [Lentzea sp. NBRC 102530]|uniref:hypothetical protein n=1 Tax=Lentzea sp. NBRC 102530 TaxID=3032201 RepID=UPI0024A55B22|nr:hypothetical protein [Lentzea sp. NBRC 102530]GLY51795.1 hypothetical protein Lesp01_54510 [Lentzea sp. NBRC 102530]
MKYYVVRDFGSDVQAVVRTRLVGEEIHAGAAGWVPSDVLRYLRRDDLLHRAEQVTEEQAGAVIAARPARRCFRVLSVEGPKLPFAVVEVDGQQERAYTRELAWGPSDLLAGLGHLSGLRVVELPQQMSAEYAAYDLAFAQRTFLRHHRWKGVPYYAIFNSARGALDLANAIALVKGDAWDEYEYGKGEWVRCSLLRGISNGGNTYEELPISPDEAHRLMERLDTR